MPFIAQASIKAASPLAPTTKSQFVWVPVLKDFLLIVRPVTTWNCLAAQPKSVPLIFGVFFLPMLLLSALAGAAGAMFLGRHQMTETAIKQITWGKSIYCELLEISALLLLVLVSAQFIKMFGNTCHRRNDLAQSLTLLLHAFGPMLVVQCLNIIPGINPWLPWAIGVALMLGALYHGLPRIMQPDPPSALGLFLGSSFVVVTLLFLLQFFMRWFFLTQFRPLQNISEIFTHAGF